MSVGDRIDRLFRKALALVGLGLCVSPLFDGEWGCLALGIICLMMAFLFAVYSKENLDAVERERAAHWDARLNETFRKHDAEYAKIWQKDA